MATFRENELIDAAMARFGEQTGLQVTRQVHEAELGPWAHRGIKIIEGNREWVFPVACKTNMDRVTALNQVHLQLVGFPVAGLLVVPYLAPELRQKCQEIGLQFMDAAGNAFLKQQGLYVLIVGQKPVKAGLWKERPTRAFDKTGLRVVYAMLAEPALMQAPYRDLAKAAGVALGTVGWILTDLREHGFLVEDAEGQRRWIDQQRAIQAWTTNFPLRLRERLNVRRFTAKEPDWWKNANPEAFGGCWGGEVAAARLMGDLVPKTVTLYLPEERNEFLAKYRLRADPHGLIEVLDTFWTFPENHQVHFGTVPPLLIYADLLGIGDPRTLEQARMIHDHYLA